MLRLTHTLSHRPSLSLMRNQFNQANRTTASHKLHPFIQRLQDEYMKTFI